MLPEFFIHIYGEITVVYLLVYGSNTEVHEASNKCLLSLLCKKKCIKELVSGRGVPARSYVTSPNYVKDFDVIW